jgi:hypothetical protein
MERNRFSERKYMIVIETGHGINYDVWVRVEWHIFFFSTILLPMHRRIHCRCEGLQDVEAGEDHQG